MTFKKVFSLAIFIAFVGLCGFELTNQIRESAERDLASVRYVRGIASETDAPAQGQAPSGATPKKNQDFNLDDILKETDLDG
ncbi:hypothetical protein LF599_01315 [Pseudodesulfovibrio thermohalotolerans]|jgi:hypothetical protein|uniref:hypothetical protein n=1 Tax=Pseudodesulfovibrio thermohalotolerans TaxID=2880651 RepID=UPI00244296E0|nr:hypothetical protein [Pseudodesulfovibrio thermohalotolerans]WFS62825.1 hypothetical protein LF599_01315 [Pseudodesulfovibrio thermohalotolerans]